MGDSSRHIGVIGAGLAGSDLAWVLADVYGLSVSLYEMKPKKLTPAQILPEVFAELVCSNSLKSLSALNPAGLLKQHLQSLNSLVIRAAFDAQVPAGESLAVDREVFGGLVTKSLREHPRIQVIEEVVSSAQELLQRDGLDLCIIATGPLTEGRLNEELQGLSGSASLYFYDAIAPIVDGESLDRSIIFAANRESKGAKDLKSANSEGADYLNIPLNREEYENFVDELLRAKKVPHHPFEEPRYFNGCQPIENLAESGLLTLAHGPMKGRGLTDPRTGRWPYAAVQLRKEKLGDESYNLVGFQTRLTWGEQKRIFKTLPGLQNAEFHRMGSMHRNTYVCAPRSLSADFTLRSAPRIALAGQIMGVEGYLESASMGCFLGHLFGQRFAHNRVLPCPPPTTPLGALAEHVLRSDPEHYCPMNINWGLIAPLSEAEIAEANQTGSWEIRARKNGQWKLDKGTKRAILAERANRHFLEWMNRFLTGRD